MSGPTRRRIEGEEFQIIAEEADMAIHGMLSDMHRIVAGRTGSLDAGPLITGALTGVVAFIMRNGHGEDRVREAFTAVLDIMPQQFAMEIAAEKAGAPEEGRA